MDSPKEPAKNPDRALDVIKKQLGKLGNTMFYLADLDIRSRPCFLSAKDLNKLRRDLIQAMEEQRCLAYHPMPAIPRPEPVCFYLIDLDFRANAANHLARQFYEKRGVTHLAPAFEIERPDRDVQVMSTKHCIRYSLGQCSGKKDGQTEKSRDPLFLENEKGRFRLVFNCSSCEMGIQTSLEKRLLRP